MAAEKCETDMLLPRYVLNFELGDRIVLLLNSVSGAIDLMPKRIIECPSGDERKTLEHRACFLSEAERMERLRRLHHIFLRHSRHVPYWFYVLTSLNCNFACPVCYEKRVLARKETTRETLDAVFGMIRTRQHALDIPNERMNVILFGGEPLCVSDPSLIRHALDCAARNGWKTVIVSNGSLIGRFLDLFGECAAAIADIRITLDGPRAVHDVRRPYRGGKASFDDVTHAIDLLLGRDIPVKMQTIFGHGNAASFEELIAFVESAGWLADPNFQWRIEASHDYANLDVVKDELSEGSIVRALIRAWDEHPALRGKMRFESFKYLGHIVRSFRWLGAYKTYWGPKFGFCEPQKGFHCVFSTDGRAYHCPRTINDPRFLLGKTAADREGWRNGRLILEEQACGECRVNTFCGGGCIVQKTARRDFGCQTHAMSVISEFVELMKDRIKSCADPDRIVSINDTWE
jgi:uncharacterized protein